MSLELKVNEQMKEAMKSGDKLRLETLRSIRAGIIEFSKNGSGLQMNEEAEIKLLNSLAKKRKDAIEMYEQAGRIDLKEKEFKELTIIQEFLPAQISEKEIMEIIKGIIEKTGASGSKDFGKVMGPSMKALSGKADGTKIQTLVKEMLGA